MLSPFRTSLCLLCLCSPPVWGKQKYNPRLPRTDHRGMPRYEFDPQTFKSYSSDTGHMETDWTETDGAGRLPPVRYFSTKEMRTGTFVPSEDHLYCVRGRSGWEWSQMWTSINMRIFGEADFNVLVYTEDSGMGSVQFWASNDTVDYRVRHPGRTSGFWMWMNRWDDCFKPTQEVIYSPWAAHERNQCWMHFSPYGMSCVRIHVRDHEGFFGVETIPGFSWREPILFGTGALIMSWTHWLAMQLVFYGLPMKWHSNRSVSGCKTLLRVLSLLCWFHSTHSIMWACIISLVPLFLLLSSRKVQYREISKIN